MMESIYVEIKDGGADVSERGHCESVVLSFSAVVLWKNVVLFLFLFQLGQNPGFLHRDVVTKCAVADTPQQSLIYIRGLNKSIIVLD
jgi:hypothetical protein